ncbi:tryptophan 7-halogenase [Parvularcula sp. LCG005]|uniref:tryptophan 7-halogenase n=1 Tax=Parvularcula sp. LCG005 TaxID=3078805 RepID=UPI0029435AB5|nr:tryptophan 7-halogenase [Parvularcula sp. LCG005]WOI53453.1 tryptophan 7-halogenase [Parvularcula sp. LCG005]
MTSPIRSVAVVGRDIAAWLTAFALKRTFGPTGLDVIVVEQPGTMTEADGYVTLPGIRVMHDLLGLDEETLITACDAVPTMGQRFSGWTADPKSFMHAYDSQGVPLNNVDFLQYWTKARHAGMKVPLEDFSVGAAAAKANRLAVGSGTDTFSRAAYSYHLDAQKYVRLCAERAAQAGVRGHAAPITEVETESGRIFSVTTADGHRVEADLFVDATGIEGALISQLPGARYDSWRDIFLLDRLATYTSGALSPLPAFSHHSAMEEGWFGLYPLQNRTMIRTAYASSHLSNDAVAEKVSGYTNMPPQGSVIIRPLNPGAREKAWIGNCVALGEAAFGVDPCDGVDIHLLQIGLSQLIAHFPVDAATMPEAGPYNREMLQHAKNIRDFQALRYRLNGRAGDRVWDIAREQTFPESMRQRLALFAARGRVAMHEHEAFDSSSWAALMIGHGIVPESYDPLVDRVSEQEQIQQFQRLLGFVSQEVGRLPLLEAHLEMLRPQKYDALF